MNEQWFETVGVPGGNFVVLATDIEQAVERFTDHLKGRVMIVQTLEMPSELNPQYKTLQINAFPIMPQFLMREANGQLVEWLEHIDQPREGWHRKRVIAGFVVWRDQWGDAGPPVVIDPSSREELSEWCQEHPDVEGSIITSGFAVACGDPANHAVFVPVPGAANLTIITEPPVD